MFKRIYQYRRVESLYTKVGLISFKHNQLI